MKKKKLLALDHSSLRKFAVVFGLLFLVWNTLRAGHPLREAKTCLYWELLGNGHFFSLNIERLLSDHIALRAGWGVTGGLLMGSVLVGRGDHLLELACGPSFGKNNDNHFKLLTLNFVCGYRYQEPRGGLLLRAGFTPVIFLDDIQNNAFTVRRNRLTPKVGVSIGYAF
jgi:hypothetical protein